MKFLPLTLLLFLFSCATGNPTNGDADEGRLVTLWVNSAKVPCTGVAPRECLQVKRSETLDAGSWENMFASIEGFDYQPGNLYKLRIRETDLPADQVPADASSIKYTLEEVLEERPDAKMRLHDIWALTAIGDETFAADQLPDGIQHPSMEFNLTEMRVMGTNGCNNFNGNITAVEDEALTFGPLAMTRKMCMGSEVPDQFTQALNAVAAYQLDGLNLMLKDAAGETLMTFKKVD